MEDWSEESDSKESFSPDTIFDQNLNSRRRIKKSPPNAVKQFTEPMLTEEKINPQKLSIIQWELIYTRIQWIR